MVKFYEYEMQDEKKTEDVDDSPLDSRKRDASIESPASETSPAFSIQKGKLFVDGKKLKKSSISPPLSPDENLESNTPLSELRRNVSFNGIGDSPPSNIPGATREESLERELQKMREKMTQVQIDYQAEKATRKRKEKNLVKLAKELNKRTAEIDVKDLHIKRLASMVNQMEEQNLVTGTEALGHDRELAAAQQTYRADCREHDARLEAMQQEHDETCRELHGQIREANKQLHTLRSEYILLSELAETGTPPDRLEAIQQEHDEACRELHGQLKEANNLLRSEPAPRKKPTVHFKKSLEPSPSNGMPKSLVSVGFVVAVLLAVLHQLDLLSMDAVCAPAMPGTTLDTQDAAFEAPWWAPPLQKESAFEALCGGRTRSRLVVSGGKVTAYSLKEGAVLWSKRAATARVGSSRLTLRDLKGHAEHVESPWLL